MEALSIKARNADRFICGRETTVCGCARRRVRTVPVGSCGYRRTKPVTCSNPAPSLDDVALIRERLAAAERALPGLHEVERQHMAMRIQYAREAVDRLERDLGGRAWCTKGKGYLFVAGAVAVSDDASVVGVADDIVLPFIAAGLVALHIMTEAPAPPAELELSWGEVTGSLDAIGRAAERLKTSPLLPPMNDCQVHFAECLGTPLGRRGSGGRHGHSICMDCEDICRGQGTWPTSTGDAKDCRWWRY